MRNVVITLCTAIRVCNFRIKFRLTLFHHTLDSEHEHLNNTYMHIDKGKKLLMTLRFAVATSASSRYVEFG